jgi:rsbT antagonist protein RsbS
MAARTTPIIRLYGNLIVSLQVELTDRVILDLRDDLAREIQTSNARGLVVEVSGVDVFDSFIAGAIQSLSRIAKLMGVHTVLAGLSAPMAVTLVEMGMTLEGLETTLNLESAIERLGREPRDARDEDEAFVLAEALR